jgi:sugar/nucleoside kinase (ribokinase family)
MPVDVLCIGHAAYDVSVFVDGYPLENSKSETFESLEACGGPAANAAYLLSSWGLNCAFAGLVGDDLYGHRIRSEFQAVGTDVSLMELRKDHATPLSMILINRQNGSRTIVNRKAKSAALVMEQNRLPALKPRVLLLDGHELDAALAALEVFPDAISILDAGSLREGTEGLAGRVDYLAASERFAVQTTGVHGLGDEASRRLCLQKLRERFATSTIITLGEAGLVMNDGQGFRHLPAFAAHAVDTTAAGDIFHGALAFCISEAMPLWESLRFASMAAALSVATPGGRSSVPPLHRVREALAE